MANVSVGVVVVVGGHGVGAAGGGGVVVGGPLEGGGLSVLGVWFLVCVSVTVSSVKLCF